LKISILVSFRRNNKDIILQELSKFKLQIKNLLIKGKSINIARQRFMVHIFGLFLGIKGRINFLQLGRFGEMCEQSFRNQFEVPFAFLAFNKNMILEHGSGQFAIAFDPSYISKTGKGTPGVGYFWSGTAAKTKWGLEIGGIAVVDIENHTAFHLEAVQTIDKLENQSLLDYYAKVLITRKTELNEISKYIVVDAYFSKKSFVEPMLTNGFEIVSRMRDDSHFCYEMEKLQTKGRGRPKKTGEKVNFNSLEPNVFELVEENKEVSIFNGKIHSKALGRTINALIVFTKKKNKTSHKIYFSTDLTLEWHQILNYYKLRFQIEFLYRDGKQHTGLNDCQARSENKLQFHHNTALTTVNLAKVTHWLKTPKDKRGSFSMADIKTMYHNELMVKKFFDVFEINPNTSKNKAKMIQIIKYGTIAA
jgi:hypothetical protein